MSRRAAVAASVLVAWGAGLALLGARELNPSSAARLADVALRVVPTTTWYMVMDSTRHVGFASIVIDTVPQMLQVTEYMVRESDAGTRRMDQLTVRTSRGLALKEVVSASMHGADSSRLTAHVSDSTLIVAGRQTDTIAVQLPALAGVLEAAVGILLDEPEVGAQTSVRALDPSTGKFSSRPLRITAESLFVVVDSAVADSSGRWFAVHRDTVRAWRMVATEAPAFDAWVDAQGLVVESRLTNGLTLKRTAFELAFQNWRNASPDRAVSARGDGNVISGTWLASGASQPTEELDSLRVLFGSTTPPEFRSRYGRSYRAGGEVAYGRTPEARLKSRYELPTTERWQNVFKRELVPGPSIESDDESIKRLAAQLAGSLTDPTAITRKIVAWVHDSLRATAGEPPVTASGALARGSGDAREFALAVAALSRAAGVPAQPVSGLLQHQGRFYVHTWTEVYLGRWVPVDAMLNQYPADASHLSFLPGSADLSPDLARRLSRLQLTVVNASPGSPAPSAPRPTPR